MAAHPDPFSPYDDDDDLIEATSADRQPRVRVYCPRQVLVVLGRGSNAQNEVDLAACKGDQIPVLRRRGGGCSVVLDPGNVIVTVVLPVHGIAGNRGYLDQLTEWLGAGLATAGITGVSKDGICDLAIGGRKISGACVYRSREVLFYSATLLVNNDSSLLARYLKHPPREPSYRGQRSHVAFVGRIVHPRYPTASQLAEALQPLLSEPPDLIQNNKKLVDDMALSPYLNRNAQ